jgi:hypothetical protein
VSNAEVESWLLKICQDMGLAVESSDDNFFAAGASSIMAVKLVAKAEETFGEDALPPDDLFTHGKLRDIAKIIVANQSHA